MAKKETVKIKKSEVPEEISEYILAGCLSRDLDPYMDAQLAEQMVSDLMEFEEGKYIGEAINTKFVLNWADEAGELGDLVEKGAEELGLKLEESLPENIDLVKVLREMLDLRDWATKADILRELDDRMFDN